MVGMIGGDGGVDGSVEDDGGDGGGNGGGDCGGYGGGDDSRDYGGGDDSKDYGGGDVDLHQHNDLVLLLYRQRIIAYLYNMSHNVSCLGHSKNMQDEKQERAIYFRLHLMLRPWVILRLDIIV